MQIRPTGNSPIKPKDDARANRAEGTPARDAGAPPAKPRGGTSDGADSIVISEEARRLAASNGPVTADGVSRGTLSPERQRAIMDRIAKGWYDSPEARRETLQLIADDLGVERPKP